MPKSNPQRSYGVQAFDLKTKIQREQNYVCDFVLGATKCGKSFSQFRGFKEHTNAHKKKEKESEESVKENATKTMSSKALKMQTNCLTSISYYLSLLKHLGKTLPDAKKEDVSLKSDWVRTLMAINSNRLVSLQKPKPYYACFMILIPKHYYAEKEDIIDIIQDNWNDPNFKVLVFVDSSSTPGPCAYHTDSRIRDSSEPTALAKKGYIVYANNITFNTGTTSEDNKNAALFFQLKWKYVGLLRNHRLDSEAVHKITFLNKSIGSKGCTTTFTNDHFLWSLQKAFDDDIPEFLEPSNTGQFIEYPLMQYLKCPPASSSMDDEDYDLEYPTSGYTSIARDLPKLQENPNLLLQSIESKIAAFRITKQSQPAILPRKNLIIIALQNSRIGPMSVEEIVQFLMSHFKPVHQECTDDKSKLRYKKNTLSMLQRHNCFKMQTRLKSAVRWLIDPFRSDDCKALITKWAENYSYEIHKCLFNTALFDALVKGELAGNRQITSMFDESLRLPLPLIISLAFKNSKTGTLSLAQIRTFLISTFRVFKERSLKPNSFDRLAITNQIQNHLQSAPFFANIKNKRRESLWTCHFSNPDLSKRMEKWIQSSSKDIQTSLINPEDYFKLISGKLHLPIDEADPVSMTQTIFPLKYLIAMSLKSAKNQPLASASILDFLSSTFTQFSTPTRSLTSSISSALRVNNYFIADRTARIMRWSLHSKYLNELNKNLDLWLKEYGSFVERSMIHPENYCTFALGEMKFSFQQVPPTGTSSKRIQNEKLK